MSSAVMVTLKRRPSRGEKFMGEGATIQDLIPFQDDAYRFAFRLTGNAADAEDAVQEAFLRAARVGGPSPGLNQRQWLLGLVSSCSAHQKRASRSRRTRERVAGVVMSQEQSSPAENNNLSDVKLALANAINALDQSLRAPVSLRYEQGLSYEEAAGILNMPEATVRKYVSRGIEQLRETLTRQGYTVAPSAIVATLCEGFGIHAPQSLAAALEHIAKTGQLPAGAVKAVAHHTARQMVAAKPASTAWFIGGTIVAAACAVLAGGALYFSQRPKPAAPPVTPLASEPKSPQDLEYVDGEIIFQDDFENGLGNFEFWAWDHVTNVRYEPQINGISNPISPRGPNQTKVLMVDTLSDKKSRIVSLKETLKKQPLAVEFDWIVDNVTGTVDIGFVGFNLCILDEKKTPNYIVHPNIAQLREYVFGQRWIHCRSELFFFKDAAGQDALMITTSNDGRIFTKFTISSQLADCTLKLMHLRGVRVAIDNVVIRKMVPKTR